MDAVVEAFEACNDGEEIKAVRVGGVAGVEGDGRLAGLGAP
jgi:hypothetical protein